MFRLWKWVYSLQLNLKTHKIKKKKNTLYNNLSTSELSYNNRSRRKYKENWKTSQNYFDPPRETKIKVMKHKADINSSHKEQSQELWKETEGTVTQRKDQNGPDSKTTETE